MRTLRTALFTAGASIAVLVSGCSSSDAPAPRPSTTTTSSTPSAGQPDRADRATEDADLAVVEKVFATDPPGLQAGQQSVIARTAADGDLVAVHWHETADPSQPWSGRAHIDLYRLAAGKVTSHWALSQDVPASGASGHTMFDDAYPATGAPPGEEDEETQRSFAVGAYDTLFRDLDPSVLDRSFDPGYLQHNPLVPDGTASLKQFFAGAGFPPQESAVSLSDGDLVWTFSRPVGSPNPEDIAAGDVFRVADGKIVEHWDVVPTAAVAPTTD